MSLLDAFLEDGLAASVLEKSDVWFAIRKDGAVGSGSREDPLDGSTAAHFDAAMADEDLVGENGTIHLGPGEFRTAGGSAWRPRNGQRIIGAGMDATTLKVENSTTNVENNVIEVGVANNAVFHTNCGTVKPFNNQTAEGEFRAGYDGTLHDQELTTEVGDVLLGLVRRKNG